MKALEKHDDTPLDLVGIVWSVNDSVRYTMIVPTETYTPAVKQAMASMHARGYAAEKLKNYVRAATTTKASTTATRCRARRA